MKQAVLVNLDRPRGLRYRHVALSALEQKFDCKVVEIGDKLGNPGADDLVALLWAGLLWEDAKLTPEDVVTLIETGESEYGEILAAVMEAFSAAFGNPKNVRGPRAKSGTGAKP